MYLGTTKRDKYTSVLIYLVIINNYWLFRLGTILSYKISSLNLYNTILTGIKKIYIYKQK